MSIYFQLTRQFNAGRLRAILGSARELVELVRLHPNVADKLKDQRPLLANASGSVAELEAALDAERRTLIHANEERLARYMGAAEDWARIWPTVSRAMADQPLSAAHATMVEKAQGVLPFSVPGGLP